MDSLKKQLFQKCILYVEKKEKTVNTTISSHQKALSSETKSSAGDKHETGRAMLQLEMEKASQQLHSVSVMKKILSKIDHSKKTDFAHLGSIVKTNLANYYLSISAGQITVKGITYFAISISSPIGKQLLGKVMNDCVNFNGNEITINEIY